MHGHRAAVAGGDWQPKGAFRAYTPLAIQGHFLERSYQRTFEFSPHAAEDFIRLRAGHARPVSAILDQRGKNIRNGQDADDVGYVRSAERVRISASVEIFMMMSDSVQNFRGDAAGPFQRVVSGRRMRFDDGSLPGIQTSRFVENGDWNFRFANVVKHCRRIQPFDVHLGQPQIQSKGDGSSSYQKAM